jgi:3-dehydroquinate synthase
VLEPGEGTKSYRGLEHLCTELLATGVDRGGLIVAFGGGVIGDLTGFAAGVLKRGIDFAQIPTTLLAQVDSSVGGKTAINTAEGKNLVGVFHQPRIVLADTGVLSTLPRRQLLAGYAEVVKYGALGDAAFFEWLEANGAKALAGDGAALVHAVAHCCRMKAASAPCSISATRSDTRWKRRRAIRTACCTAKAWRWARRWHSGCR